MGTATKLFEHVLSQQLNPALHTDCRQLLNYLYDETFPCAGPMSETNILEGLKCLRKTFTWNRLEFTESQDTDELYARVVEDDFLRVIFHLPQQSKFFCYKLGEQDRDFLYGARSSTLYSKSDVIIGLFRKPNSVLEVVFYPCVHRH